MEDEKITGDRGPMDILTEKELGQIIDRGIIFARSFTRAEQKAGRIQGP